MNRKLIIALAIILPLTGIGMLVAWAGSARQAAFQNAELVPVVQAAKEIPAGTTSAELPNFTRVAELPRAMVPADAPASLEELKEGAVRYQLAPGELLTDAKIFAEEDGLEGAPENYEEVTVLLDAERGSNQLVKVGDTVAVYASFTSPEERTTRVLSEVLISRIGGDTKVGKGAAAEAAAGNLLVTFAVTSDDAKKIIYSNEFGEIWLAVTNPSSSDEETADPAEASPEDATVDDVTEGEAAQ